MLAAQRFFFVGFGLFAIAISAIAFVPEYARFAASTFPIAPELHVHAALMEVWLATFVLQAWLGATGRVAWHRRIGPYGIALGVAASASMIFVVGRGLVVHPPTAVRDYDEMLQDAYVVLTFATLLFWAFHERRRPARHKRLMAITTFVALSAPVERMEWLPELGIGYIFASAVWLDLCLIVPLVAYDVVSTKRVHVATAQGLAFMLAMQAAMVVLWGTPLWRSFAVALTSAVRAAF